MQEAKVTMYLRQAWNDPRLQFEDQGPSEIRMYDWDRMWVPDTFFRSEVGAYVHDQMVPNRLMRLKRNGDIWYVLK